MYQLTNRKALVTGGASGIGRAIAVRLAEEGCDVGLLDLAEAGARETAQMIEAKGRKAAVAIGDVGNRGDVDRGVATLGAAIGAPDILVNSAGILRVGAMLEQPHADFAAQFRVNVDGTFHVCQAVVPGMVARGRGAVVNLASWLGKKGMKLYGGYAASKFAVIGMTQTLALEVAGTGVRVNALCPGLIVETGMRDQAEAVHKSLGLPSAAERVTSIPLGRLGVPADIARVAAFLVSDEADFMTGQAINVTGGFWLN
jgi:NAD(P)-dependent dehydrogenase (short-subunit alcohol dehydrogenase family)